jgi:hypothetical protein
LSGSTVESMDTLLFQDNWSFRSDAPHSVVLLLLNTVYNESWPERLLE